MQERVPSLGEKARPPTVGLSSVEAEAQLEQHGFNEITEKRSHPALTFLKFFWGPIPWMIEAAMVLAAVIRHWETFAIILAMLLLNAVVGFWQRQRADNAIARLQQRLALQARVRRDGQWREMAARELVPGDLVRVRLGDIVPADLRLLQGQPLLIDESTLTGESLPVEKTEGGDAYTGSVIRQGEMDALVVATGKQTFFGQTARLVAETRTESHFQKALVKIGDYLIITGLALVMIIFLVALFRHEDILLILQYALVLTVASIPATLPAVLSVTLAVGAGMLARQGAITRNMSALDEFAGMDVLCSDKTGTITENALTVAEVSPFGGFSRSEVLLAAALASREEDRDPLDLAVIGASRKQTGEAGDAYEILDFKPFDPVAKHTEALVTGPAGRRFRAAKGAPQAILALAGRDPGIQPWLHREVNRLAAKGYRALGVCQAEVPGDWVFLGLISLYDPPREDSGVTIQAARELGVGVKMVTGDHLAIAREIAAQVHLGTNIHPVSAIIDKPDREARRLVEQADGFAQVFPESKFHIVELLQANGHIVGMTGDGVNDAPALKKADVGIAVAGATDAAKSAADIVLTRPGLSVIIDGIRESRNIFQRMKSYAIYRIGGIIRQILFITLSIALFNFYPVTALMIVLITLLNDLPILSIAYDRARPSPGPERWEMREVLSLGTFLGIMGVFFTFGLYFVGVEVLRLPAGQLQTVVFLKLTVAGYLDIFMGRTRRFFWSLAPGSLLLWSGLASRALATAIAFFGWFVSPIEGYLVLLVYGWAVLELVITDPLKVLVYKVVDHTGIKFSRRYSSGQEMG